MNPSALHDIIAVFAPHVHDLFAPGPGHLVIYAMLLDFITGWLVGFKTHQASTTTSREGIIRKASYFGAILLAWLVDLVTKQSSPLALTVTTLFLFFTEAMSVTEHLAVLGVPLPAWLKARLAKLRDIYDMGGEDPDAHSGS